MSDFDDSMFPQDPEIEYPCDCGGTQEGYYDCPTRERAGWLCDSALSAKTEFFLTGENTIEKSFLNNFILGKDETLLPKLTRIFGTQ